MSQFFGLVHFMWWCVVLFAAWWHEQVVVPFEAPLYDWFNFIGRIFWPRYSAKIAMIALRVLPFLVGEFIVWPIAKDFLQAKWEAERLEQNRRYWL